MMMIFIYSQPFLVSQEHFTFFLAGSVLRLVVLALLVHGLPQRVPVVARAAEVVVAPVLHLVLSQI